jgi:hypothetical protein
MRIGPATDRLMRTREKQTTPKAQSRVEMGCRRASGSRGGAGALPCRFQDECAVRRRIKQLAKEATHGAESRRRFFGTMDNERWCRGGRRAGASAEVFVLLPCATSQLAPWCTSRSIEAFHVPGPECTPPSPGWSLPPLLHHRVSPEFAGMRGARESNMP